MKSYGSTEEGEVHSAWAPRGDGDENLRFERWESQRDKRGLKAFRIPERETRRLTCRSYLVLSSFGGCWVIEGGCDSLLSWKPLPGVVACLWFGRAELRLLAWSPWLLPGAPVRPVQAACSPWPLPSLFKFPSVYFKINSSLAGSESSQHNHPVAKERWNTLSPLCLPHMLLPHPPGRRSAREREARSRTTHSDDRCRSISPEEK